MSEEMKGQLRHILTTLGGIAVSNGYVTDATVQLWIGVGITFVGFVWSWNSKKPE